jgi:hypothetical protein
MTTMIDCGCDWHDGGLEGYGGLIGYGLFTPHHCASPSWRPAVQAKLDKAADIADLARIWEPLEQAGAVDSTHGAEWHHALAHMVYLQERSSGPS